MQQTSTQSSVFDYSIGKPISYARRSLLLFPWLVESSSLGIEVLLFLVFSWSSAQAHCMCLFLASKVAWPKVDARVEAPKAKGRGSDVFVVDHTL